MNMLTLQRCCAGYSLVSTMKNMKRHFHGQGRTVRKERDYNQKKNIKSREEKDKDWEFVVKMTLIIRDLRTGNKKLGVMGHQEEALGHNALVSGFQGQRQWTDFLPNGDFPEAILNSSFDWNGRRSPYMIATENDSMNGVSMLFNYLLTNTAQIFADVRTYWSPDAVKRVSGWAPDGVTKNGFIHLINSGSATLDGTGKQRKDGKPAMKPFWDIDEKEVEACLQATTWYPANRDYFRGGGYSSKFVTEGEMPVTMCRLNMVKEMVLQIAALGPLICLISAPHTGRADRQDPADTGLKHALS